MENKIINCPEQLLDELETLQKNGFILRGHSSSKYFLQPQAFREQDKHKIVDKYPVSKAITTQWKQGGVLEKMRQWSIGQLPHPIITARILNYALYLLQYNYYLTQYYIQLPPLYSSTYDQEQSNRLKGKHLAKEQTFINFIEYLYPKLLTRISPAGEILSKSIPPQEITGYDETWPQHYSFPSAALDWTLSVPIALHFAIRKLNEPPSSGTKMLSICCYKQIATKNSPVKIIEKDELKTNERAVKQEGMFTYFMDPCSYYLNNGVFPSVEAYSHGNPYFTVIKRNIEINKKNLEFFKKYTKLHRIDDEFLLLDYKYDLSKHKLLTENV